MKNYYKYLPVSEEDAKWGLCVLSAGYNRIKKGEDYPSAQHPSHHYFNWNKGRVLDEYQVIYISKGKGIFESASCPQQTVTAGTVLFLFPGEWHRFKPMPQTGWNEYWVACKGVFMDHFVAQNFFAAGKAVVSIGIHETVVHLLSEIIEKTKEEQPGYQQLVAGMVVHLLGEINSITKKSLIAAENINAVIINKARTILRENIDQDVLMEDIAAELNVSYAWFRKAFKMYTGIAPNQYLLQLKIEKAKMLLADPAKSVKEIAFTLNFESTFYFSSLFKEKTGVSPVQYRANIRM